MPPPLVFLLPRVGAGRVALRVRVFGIDCWLLGGFVFNYVSILTNADPFCESAFTIGLKQRLYQLSV